MEIFFSGQIDKDRTLTYFSHIDFKPNNILNVFDSFKQRMFVDKNKKLYEWSKTPEISTNFPNKIELKECEFVNEEFKSEDPSSKETIIDIKNTKSQIFLLTDQHKLALIQLSNTNKNPEKSHFTLISRDFFPEHKIIKISCGSGHVLALTDKGTVFSWGSNSNGRLGQGNKEDITEPSLMYHLIAYNIIDISAGLGHNIVLGIKKKDILTYEQQGFNKFKSKVIAWGNGNSGCLGNCSNDDLYIPSEIDFFDDKSVKEAAAGYTHSSVLTFDGKLYTFGNNEYGQLGCDQSNNENLEPRVVKFDEIAITNNNSPYFNDVSLYKRPDIKLRYVEKMFVGPFHMMAILNDGNIYSWGLGSYGQLGTEELSPSQTTPKKISLKCLETSKDDKLNWLLHPNNIRKIENSIKMVLSFESSFIFIANPENSNAINLDNIEDVENVSIKTDNTNENTHENKSVMNETTIYSESNNNSFAVAPKNETPFIYEFNTFFASRPQNLPPKNREEEEKHKKMIEQQKKTFLKKLREEENKKQKTKEKKEKSEYKTAKAKREWSEEILPKWNEKRNTDHVKNLVYFGIPTSMRSQIWTKQIKNRLSLTREYYEVFLAKGRSLSQKYQDFKKLMKESKDNSLSFSSLHSDDPLISKLSKESTVKMIEVDLPRTFPNLAIFNQDGPVNSNLKDLLQAFACSRPDIGYIQGMSYIAGLLLLYLDTYDAFVCFSNLITQPFLLDFFLLEEKPIISKLDIFKVLLKWNLPDLYSHFEQENLSTKMYAFEWFLTLYSKALNLDFVSRIWDIFFLEGPIVLYKTGIAILKHLEEFLMGKELLNLVKIIKNLGDYIKDEDELVKSIKSVVIPPYITQEIERNSL